jgi:hypothetical protein
MVLPWCRSAAGVTAEAASTRCSRCTNGASSKLSVRSRIARGHLILAHLGSISGTGRAVAGAAPLQSQQTALNSLFQLGHSAYLRLSRQRRRQSLVLLWPLHSEDGRIGGRARVRQRHCGPYPFGRGLGDAHLHTTQLRRSGRSGIQKNNYMGTRRTCRDPIITPFISAMARRWSCGSANRTKPNLLADR